MFALPLQSGAAGGMFLIGLLSMVLFLTLTYWVYKDAQKHSQHSAFVWAIVVLLAPLLGLVLYFLLGRDGGAGGEGHRRSQF